MRPRRSSLESTLPATPKAESRGALASRVRRRPRRRKAAAYTRRPARGALLTCRRSLARRNSWRRRCARQTRWRRRRQVLCNTAVRRLGCGWWPLRRMRKRRRRRGHPRGPPPPPTTPPTWSSRASSSKRRCGLLTSQASESLLRLLRRLLLLSCQPLRRHRRPLLLRRHLRRHLRHLHPGREVLLVVEQTSTALLRYATRCSRTPLHAIILAFILVAGALQNVDRGLGLVGQGRGQAAARPADGHEGPPRLLPRQGAQPLHPQALATSPT